VQPSVALAVNPLDPAVGGVVAAELAASVADHAAVRVASDGELDVRRVRESDLAEQPEHSLGEGRGKVSGQLNRARRAGGLVHRGLPVVRLLWMSSSCRTDL
jgi:hypothetical protein